MDVFNNKEALEQELLSDLIEIINAAINKFGDSRILLSGGSTPKHLYQKFAETDIDWTKVHIGLVDDRNVPLDNDFSNEKMIRNIFSEANVDLVSIYSMTKREVEQETINEYNIFKSRTDFVLLGMGTDGHTASLFPDDKTSEALLNSEEISIAQTNAPQYPQDRITCSKGLIKNSYHIALMIFGEEKKEVFNQSKIDRKPITYFIEECPQMKTYYSSLP
ncbi:MAG: 6-phosphogluconolactonase [Crocinitomicaceae bacterium]